MAAIPELSRLSIPVNSNPEVRCETLDQRHIPEAIEVFARSFCHDEPMTAHLKIGPDEFRPLAETFIKKAAHDGLSTVVLDNNQVVACSIVEDIADPVEVNPEELDPRFGSIFAFLGNLSSFFADKKFQKGNLSHLFVTAVDPNHRNKGHSRAVNLSAIQNAKEKGFQGMCCEFTDARNEQGTLKHIQAATRLVGSCEYAQFELEDQKPFEKLEGKANAYIWELQPDAVLHLEGDQPPLRIKDLNI